MPQYKIGEKVFPIPFKKDAAFEFDFKNDLETDLKNYFATKVPFAGPDKYEAYNKYRETGEFDLSLVSSSQITAVVKEEQKRQIQ